MEVVEDSVVVEASTGVEVSAVAVSTAVAFVVAALEAESAAAEVESALVEHTSRVVLGTLPAEDRASLHLVIRHPGSLSLMGGPIDPCLATSRAMVARCLQSHIHHKHLRNTD